MAHGRKTGGRRIGSVNKVTGPFRERLRAMVEEVGADPFRYMASVIADPGQPVELRLRAANDLARYLEPALKATDLTISGNPEQPIVVRIRRSGEK